MVIFDFSRFFWYVVILDVRELRVRKIFYYKDRTSVFLIEYKYYEKLNSKYLMSYYKQVDIIELILIGIYCSNLLVIIYLCTILNCISDK